MGSAYTHSGVRDVLSLTLNAGFVIRFSADLSGGSAHVEETADITMRAAVLTGIEDFGMMVLARLVSASNLAI